MFYHDGLGNGKRNLSLKKLLTLFPKRFSVSAMKKTKRLSDGEITNKIRAMNDFVVMTESERKRVLWISSILGADVTTRKQKGGGFRVFIPSEIPN